ncbi:MAG: 4-hydroxythreonine-4-phosphate dehydrogenase PdxA [Omnitrophica bacterium RIFOXYB12_FULL_50_7]|nr:MAG: 4-hydroxythreonine-4-phosphate dehydrogenase PdxA [Omnitrophica bacterium RIFOXYB12_FULL_50_7]
MPFLQGNEAVKTPVIALTMGDPGGIGPEILVKALQKEKPSRCLAYLLIGSRKVFKVLCQKTGLWLPFKTVHSVLPGTLRAGNIYFLDVSSGFPGRETFKMGKLCRENGRLALAAIEKAASLAKQGIVDAIVTAPVNKSAIRLVDRKFIGHTEFLAYKAGARRFAMMFVSPHLNVTLATIHVPLKKVSGLLTKKSIFEKILLTDEMLKKGFAIKKPRIAVCALNPHGGECGDEEAKVIAPAVRAACRKGINAFGPFSADLLFHAAYHGQYDAVIGMYHDQVLAPFKLVAFHDGVNVTLGLPYIRTSPDHGTAFDIAYQGKADPSSMLAALRLAKKAVLAKCSRR